MTQPSDVLEETSMPAVVAVFTSDNGDVTLQQQGNMLECVQTHNGRASEPRRMPAPRGGYTVRHNGRRIIICAMDGNVCGHFACSAPLQPKIPAGLLGALMQTAA